MYRAAVNSAAAALVVFGFAVHAPAKSGEYRLGPGDQIRINVYEWPDLTDTFRVSPNGSVFLMFVGEVPAEGLTASKLARDISTRLKDKAQLEEPPTTSVEVTTFRPFFVLGDVQSPGEYAYRPNITVLQAIGVAGGMYRVPEEERLRLQREATNNRGQLTLLEREIDRLTARKARLDAELDELDSVEFPDVLVARKGEAYIDKLLNDESLLFSSYMDQRSEQVEVLSLLQRFYETEVDSMTEHLEDVENQVESAEEQLEKVGSLVSRGLAPTPRRFDMERLLVSMTGNQRDLESNILRAQQNIAQTKKELLDVHWQRRERVVLQRQETQAALDEAIQKADTTEQLLQGAVTIAPQTRPGGGRPGDIELEYEIVRNVDGEQQTLSVQDDFPVEPGDVIRVRRILDEGLPPSVPMAGSRLQLHPDRQGFVR